MSKVLKWGYLILAPAISSMILPAPAWAQGEPIAQSQAGVDGARTDPVSGLAAADLFDLAEPASLVVVAEVRRVSELREERAGAAQPGWARLYVEARTRSLLSGSAPVGEELRYLVDVRRDERGRVPRLKGRTVILFADPVPGRPDELKLVAPDAQLPADEATVAQVRRVLTELMAADAAPVVSGVRDALNVPGNLAGESETQIFLTTTDGSAATISVVRRPGADPRWSLSVGELVGAGSGPPAHGSLAWYRLACALPRELPEGANLSPDAATRAQAAADYALVLRDLGPCERRRTF